MLSFLLTLALLPLLAQTASATLAADARVRQLNAGNATLCGYGGSGTTFSEASCSGSSYAGEAVARADYGDLGTYAELAWNGGDDEGDDFQAYGQARWSDRLTLRSPLLIPGTLTDARLVINVTFGPGANTRPPFTDGGTLFLEGTLRVVIDGQEISPNTGEIVGSPFGTYFYDFDFNYGSDVNAMVEITSDVRCFNCGDTYLGRLDYLNSVVLQEVDLLGVEDFTVESGEGAAYANVVPEPGFALLLLSGLAGLSAYGRERRN